MTLFILNNCCRQRINGIDSKGIMQAVLQIAGTF